MWIEERSGRKERLQWSLFFFFISLEFLVLVPNFRAGRHLPYLWKKKKSGEGKRYHPRGMMKDDALRQGRAEYTRSNDRGQRASAASRGDDKEAATADVRDSGKGGTCKEEPSKTFRSADSCQWNPAA